MADHITMPTPPTLPRSLFCTEDLRKSSYMTGGAIEDAWTYALSYLRSEKIVDPLFKQKFNPPRKIDGYMNVVPFPGFMAMQVAGSAQKLSRCAADIAIDGFDGIMVQYTEQGEISSEHTYGFDKVEAGDIFFVDLAREARVTVSKFNTYNLLVPRNLFENKGLDAEKLHMFKLSGNTALTDILGRHIKELLTHAETMTISEAEAVTEPTLALIEAAVSTSKAKTGQSSATIVHGNLSEIKKFIDDNLTNPELEADTIAQHLGLSRAKLYRIADPLGGIQRFIKNRRLHHAFRSLTKETSQIVSISSLAYDMGFSSENTFRRAFKEEFELTPTEARKQGQRAYRAHLASVGLEDTLGEKALENFQFKEWTQELFH